MRLGGVYETRGDSVIAAAAGVPTVAIAGTLGAGYQRLRDIGIVAAFSITSGPMTLESACADAAMLLRHRAADVVQLWKVARVGVS
ncbi:glycerate kinase [Pseudomonas aeruginosa]|uniref:glycerate kinase n=1 Tax=Pseudomonas aeruginosa TaxID=287 RepID=UPI003982A73E